MWRIYPDSETDRDTLITKGLVLRKKLLKIYTRNPNSKVYDHDNPHHWRVRVKNIPCSAEDGQIMRAVENLGGTVHTLDESDSELTVYSPIAKQETGYYTVNPWERSYLELSELVNIWPFCYTKSRKLIPLSSHVTNVCKLGTCSENVQMNGYNASNNKDAALNMNEPEHQGISAAKHNNEIKKAKAKAKKKSGKKNGPQQLNKDNEENPNQSTLFFHFQGNNNVGTPDGRKDKRPATTPTDQIHERTSNIQKPKGP
ncbi:Hypothetical predicted protein [Mytilus galloprovincialis]|uniref:Uncharacterized protein n=1 Tax=Mytilus galloprovincialis TaxID=29158 RepID=A0A8B6EXK3_MYTGA|nr:Hypothetical predicted protein [Mytilus galloprovincialis]